MAVSQANFFPEPYILYWNDCNGKAKSDFLGKKSLVPKYLPSVFAIFPFFKSKCIAQSKEFQIGEHSETKSKAYQYNLDFSIFTVRF